jgi:hypothetical protein
MIVICLKFSKHLNLISHVLFLAVFSCCVIYVVVELMLTVFLNLLNMVCAFETFRFMTEKERADIKTQLKVFMLARYIRVPPHLHTPTL